MRPPAQHAPAVSGIPTANCRSAFSTRSSRAASTNGPASMSGSNALPYDAARSSAQGAVYVLRSLTRNHRGVLEHIAAAVTDAAPDMAFDALLAACSDSMLASTEGALRSLLNELCDHRVVAYRAAAGVVSLLIPKAELEAAMASNDNNG